MDIWGVTDPSDFQSTCTLFYYLDEYDPNNNISVNGYKPQCITSCKLLGVHINEHLKWDDHVKHTLHGWYDPLSILRKLKYLAKYELKKHGLILPLPQFLLSLLQQTEFAAASFVLGQYFKNFRDVLKN